jgi:alpha-beta hydrolase superfamily lysophospholipase
MLKRILVKSMIIIIGVYLIFCGLLYTFQERLLFFPQKLNEDFKFSFNQTFKEINLRTPDDIILNGVLFKTDSARGLIFYLHGNAGSINSWGHVAKAYTDLNYDVFILDYRGYGKSEGEIENQAQVYEDIQISYDSLKQRYSEENIIVLGYSIGTGLASKLASENDPKLLILQAPYYSLTDMMKQNFPFIPTIILKYKFNNNEHIGKCKMPIVIFHGDRDEVIYYESSLKLKEELSTKDTLITLHGQKHNGMTDNKDYIKAIEKILN